jgi:hypothetical protein
VSRFERTLDRIFVVTVLLGLVLLVWALYTHKISSDDLLDLARLLSRVWPDTAD